MLVLSQAEVARLLDVDQLLDALERAFVELSAGRASVPPRIAAFSEHGLLGAMPGYVDGVLAAKLVTLFPDHEPSHQALIAVFDAETGTPTAVMDGTHITAVRTGGGSAVATRALARDDARVLTILGGGVQGRSHLDAVGPRTRLPGGANSEPEPRARPRVCRGDRRDRGRHLRGGRGRCRRRLRLHERGRARPTARLARSGHARHVGRQLDGRAGARSRDDHGGVARDRVARGLPASACGLARAPGP